MEWWMWVILYFVIGFLASVFYAYAWGKSDESITDSGVVVTFVLWPLAIPVMVGLLIFDLMETINEKAKEKK